jgi:two-component system, sensor histidine kinase and response regulator
MDGFDATRAIRRYEAREGARIPVIAMTANTSAGYREQCLEAGMDDYLAKPVLLTSLQSVLDRWLALPEAEPARSRVELEAGARPPFPRLHSIFKGDRTAIFKVLDSALRTFDEMIDALSLAIEQNDPLVAGRSAHRMAGVALDVESELIANLARAIESSCAGEPSWPALAAHFDQLDAAVESYRLEVARYGESE